MKKTREVRFERQPASDDHGQRLIHPAYLKYHVGDPGPEGEQDPGSAPNLPEGFGGRGPSGGETINPGYHETGSHVVDPSLIGGNLGQYSQADLGGQPVPDSSGTAGGGPGSGTPHPQAGGNIDYEEGQPSDDTRRDDLSAMDIPSPSGSQELPDPTGSSAEEEGFD